MKNDSVGKSNIELLRIVSMFMILTHHYVVNSGIMEGLALFGMWGKPGINICCMFNFRYDQDIFV